MGQTGVILDPAIETRPFFGAKTAELTLGPSFHLGAAEAFALERVAKRRVYPPAGGTLPAAKELSAKPCNPLQDGRTCPGFCRPGTPRRTTKRKTRPAPCSRAISTGLTPHRGRRISLCQSWVREAIGAAWQSTSGARSCAPRRADRPSKRDVERISQRPTVSVTAEQVASRRDNGAGIMISPGEGL